MTENQELSKLIKVTTVLIERQNNFYKTFLFLLLFLILSTVFIIWSSVPLLKNFSLIINNMAEDSRIIHDSINSNFTRVKEKDIDVGEIFKGIEDFIFIIKNIRNAMEDPNTNEVVSSANNLIINLSKGAEDITTLLKRVKQDSDVVREEMFKRLKENPREYFLYTNTNTENIENFDIKFVDLNSKILSPASSIFRIQEKVAHELNFLNKNMIIMSNNMMTMGHTMGRMGSWLP